MSRHRIRRVFLALIGLLALFVLIAIAAAFLQGRRTPTGQADYVALGSSFAAGAGLGPLQSGSPMLCARSTNGYPQQLARLRGLSLVDMSCGGAVTRNVLDGGQFFQGAQIRTITPQTRLVTITVGGNDIGYIADLSQLAARHTPTVFGRLVDWFWNGPRSEAARNYDGLRRAMSATLRAVHTRAPGAVVVLATFPTILPPAGTCDRIGLTDGEAASMRKVGDDLAAVTRSVAAQGGAILVDMHKLSATHNACAAMPWTNGWTNGGIAPFHPNLAGARATASAISDALAQRPAISAR